MFKKLAFISLFAIFSLTSCGGKDEVLEDTIYINVGPDVKTLDPTLSTSVDESVYIVHTFEGLVTKDKDNKLAPGVASSWDISDDGLVYTFKLRDDAVWSDGKPITADDFVYSWKRAVDPIVASEYSYQMEPIKNASDILYNNMPIDNLGVKALDDKTLEVTLEVPTAYFLQLASFQTYYPVRKDIIDAHGDQWALSPETYISNGPYIMTERSPNDKIVLEKNTNYWDSASVVANKLVFILMENPNSAVAGIKEGSLHFALNPPPQDITTLTEEGLLKINPYLGTQYYIMNLTNKFLSNENIRKALSLSIDRSYIVENITKGGEIAAGAWVPYGVSDVKGDFRENGGNYFSVEAEDYEKNVALAKELLTEAGYPNGKGIDVIEFYSRPGIDVTIFEAIQQMWKEHLGIDTTITQEEFPVHMQRLRDQNFVIARSRWIADYNDPMTFIDLFTSTSPRNNGLYTNIKYDELVNTAKLSFDNNVRMKAMHEAESILMSDMGIIPIYFYTEPILVSKELKGIIYDSLGFHRFTYSYLED